MMKRIARTFSAAVIVLGASAGIAGADSCSGHPHTTGTILGAAGGGVLGGVITHGSPLGIVGGAVAGGFAGNAISRDVDCHGHRYHRYWSARYHHYSWRRVG